MNVLLWCWDARMTWGVPTVNQRVPVAVANQPFPYPYPSDVFTRGFRLLIDYCESIGIDGIILWGFLRDAHGGVRAAQDLCLYAKDHGVAILPGVGLCSYGGFYFEGDHRFNLSTYFAKHPERATSAFDGGLKKTIGPVLDPSDPANAQWWKDGTEWMLETFDIGGINYEMGDHLVHPSSRAQARREALALQCQGSLQDMVIASSEPLKHALAIKPDGMFINSTYLPSREVTGFPVMDFTRHVPDKTYWMYTMGKEVLEDGFPETSRCTPPHRQAAYLHWGRAGGEESNKDYRQALTKAVSGLQSLEYRFVSLYGELSAEQNAVADRNYRTVAEAVRQDTDGDNIYERRFPANANRATIT